MSTKLTEKDQRDLFEAKAPTVPQEALASAAPKAFEDPQKGLKGNLGEWSEVYAFLKLLADGVLPEKHEDHQHKRVSRRLVIVNVIKEYPNPTLYHVASKAEPTFKSNDIFVMDSDGEGGFSPIYSKVIPRVRFQEACAEMAAVLKHHINQRGTESKAVFTLPQSHPAMTLIKELGWTSIKAPSKVKADLTVTTSSSLTRTDCKTLTYSIKSSLGSAATLFNANKTTNLDYSIVPIDATATPPFTPDLARKLNAISSSRKIKDRMALLKAEGYTLKYLKPRSEIFSDNLRSSAQGQEIDQMIQVMLARYYYVDGEEKQVAAIKDFLPVLVEEDPLGFKKKFNDQTKVQDIYRQTVKKLLLDMALGMTASASFDGEKVRDQVSGGMLVVNLNSHGDPSVEMQSVLHHKQMEEYLFEKTTLETASTKRHGFASAYFDEESSSWRMSLNLQIRFVKEKAVKVEKAKPPVQNKLF